MRLSTKSRYGLRAMLVLAHKSGEEPVMTKVIADKQNLPVTYLEQLMLTLRKAGLVVATRGAKGGYVLAQAPESISLCDIVESLEGPLDIADCQDVSNCCEAPEYCALKEVFAKANLALREVFSSRTLAQLLEEQEELKSGETYMYQI